MRQAAGGPIAAAKLNAATSAAVAACDAGDGVADGVINDPRKCGYDPAALVCREGSDRATCLTPAEAAAVKKIWEGPVSATSGERLWFGLERGTPLTGLAGDTPFPIATTHARYWVRQDPRFRTRGGRMIVWHGEADGLIFPRGTVNYFNRVVAANGGPDAVDRFARLFLAPGVGHCGGGDGPSPAGVFEALVNWVENGVAPDRLASARSTGGATRTRPLCRYPQTAQWTGTGSTDDAANFACVDGRHEPQDFAVGSGRPN
jgi:hypothetical protein